MADKKVVFIAFAIEDVRQRDFLKGQSLHPRAPFEFVDMSVKEAYSSEWEEKVRTRIKRSYGIIVLVSKNSNSSSGQKWFLERLQFSTVQITTPRTTSPMPTAHESICSKGEPSVLSATVSHRLTIMPVSSSGSDQ